MTKTKNFEIIGGPVYPVLPLRDIVVFPHMIVPLFVGRQKSIHALESTMQEDKRILLVAQRDSKIEDPRTQDLYTVGTFGQILQLLKLPDGTIKVLVEGSERARILRYEEQEPYFVAEAQEMPDIMTEPQEEAALVRTTLSLFEQYLKLDLKVAPDILTSIMRIDRADRLSDTLASHLGLKIPERQALLEIPNVNRRLEQVCAHMESEIGILNAERRIRKRVKGQMEKSHRDFYLNEQLKAIQRELGDGEDGQDEIRKIEAMIAKTRLTKEAREKAQNELKKLKTMSPMSSEATVVRNYLDWLLSIPWKKPSKIKHDLDHAKDILDQDHYGLEKVKERILEYLAVQSRVGVIKGPILCLVGPPGVGKTSLGQSVARATGRRFVRVSLGGVRDEAEIRGHRRTYVGSMPGKVVQGMKKAAASNPLFLLDEIDKMSSDWRGDPGSALLEVLDPEQNTTFNDHYLEVDYDLSDVMFITTANSTNVSQPLLDRMEVIRLSGYTEEEKIEIAKRHLLPKQMKNHGLKSSEFTLEDDALKELIRIYTREAGVRGLEREISNLLRKGLRKILSEKKKSVTITTKNLADFAGIPRYRYGVLEKDDLIGVTTGLAWTEVGGELLSIEAVMLPGKGKMTITGKLGEVMQESVQAAASFVRSRAVSFGIEPPLFEKNDIHVHVPEGAIPKDGPSAGVAMCTTIVSVLTGIPVRKDVAMTGEITLRGHVLAIGGLKEKLLAAHRGGIKTVLIPEDNVKDLKEIPENVQKGLAIIAVKTVDEVIEHALTQKVQAITWVPPKESGDKGDRPQAH